MMMGLKPPKKFPSHLSYKKILIFVAFGARFVTVENYVSKLSRLSALICISFYTLTNNKKGKTKIPKGIFVYLSEVIFIINDEIRGGKNNFFETYENTLKKNLYETNKEARFTNEY